jgi:hypothetical protein
MRRDRCHLTQTCFVIHRVTPAPLYRPAMREVSAGHTQSDPIARFTIARKKTSISRTKLLMNRCHPCEK